MVNFVYKQRYTYTDLQEIVRILRGSGGCSWDAAQTHESLRRCLMEESCEVLDAIDRGNMSLLCEELGDVLLQVVFHASLAEDTGHFTLDDVADGICRKMISRHPHVFADEGDTAVQQHAAENWEQMKRREKGWTSGTETMEAVARTLPGLWRVEKLRKRAAQAGDPVDEKEEAVTSLENGITGLRYAWEKGESCDQWLGNVLFAAASFAYASHVDAEEILHQAADRYMTHFSCMEQKVLSQGRVLSDLTKQERKQIWIQTEEA